MVPVVTIVGAQIGYLLSGAIVVEYAFGLNGIGTLLVSSVQGKDYAVVQAIALFVTAEFLTISLIVDLLYGVIDPRCASPGLAMSLADPGIDTPLAPVERGGYARTRGLIGAMPGFVVAVSASFSSRFVLRAVSRR